MLEFHRKSKTNVGDFYCNPSRYFEFENISSHDLYDDVSAHNKNIIIGGGGLIHKKFQNRIQELIHQKPKDVVLWGVGHNFSKRHVQKSKTDVFYPSWLKHASLYGIRDWKEGNFDSYLPCVSCMHPLFDNKYEEFNDIAYFTHAFKTSFNLHDTVAHMANNTLDLKSVIEFLGSARTIVTDSYHGAYWAQLLGKNVQVVSWSVKFDFMKTRPEFISNINDKIIYKSNSDAGYLDECRELNKRFYQQTLDTFS